MFYNNTSFNQPLDLWDVSNITDMGNTFKNASSFNQPLNQWNTTSLSSVASLFNGATAFNQPLNQWNTTSLTNASYTFYRASAFNQSLNSWNTALLMNVTSMFQEATAFNQLLNSWNTASLTNASRMFYGASAFNRPLNVWNTTSLTDASSMFQEATAFNQPLDQWNTALLTNASYMFYGATAFNQPLNSWNTTSLTNASYMFREATAFNQPLDQWNTALLTNASYMFYGATAFNQPLDQWNTALLTNASYMFYGATAFNQPLNSWNTASLINASRMFYGASAFNRPLNLWNTTSLTTASHMFREATAFNQPLGDFNLASITDMTWMLYESNISITNFNKTLQGWAAQSLLPVGINVGGANYSALGLDDHDILTNAPNLWTFHIGSLVDSSLFEFIVPTIEYDPNYLPVINVDDMFSILQASPEVLGSDTKVWVDFKVSLVAGALASLTDGLFMDSTNAATANMTILAFDAIPLSRQSGQFKNYLGAFPTDATDIPTLHATTSGAEMFSGAVQFNQTIGAWDTSTMTDLSNTFNGAVAFNQDLSTWDLSSALTTSAMFANTAAFDSPINLTTTTFVTDMSSMFANAAAFNQPIDALNVSTVANMANMFSGTTAFNQPLTTWDTSAVTDTTGMFDGAAAFNQDLSAWDLSSALTTSAMFANTTAFDSPINLTTTTSVTDMSSMFANAAAFNQPIDALNVSTVTNMANMFSGTTAFDQPLTTWDTSAVTDMSSMFANAAAFNQPIDALNVSTVANMANMFSGTTAFDQPLTTWDTSAATDMSGMFYNAAAFNQILKTFVMANVASATTMFTGSNMSVTAFNKTMLGWSEQATLPVALDVGGVDYSAVGVAARTVLTSAPHLWTFSSGSLVATSLFVFSRPTVSFFSPTGTLINMFKNTHGSFTHLQHTPEVSGTDTIVYTDFIFDDTGGSAEDGLLIYGSSQYAVHQNSDATIVDFGGIPLSRSGRNFYAYLGTYPTDSANIPVLLPGGSLTDMFRGSINFNQQIGSWDTSTVTSMANTFNYAKAFNQPINSWDTSSVVNMSGTFFFTTNFNQPLDNWDVSNVTTMTIMFSKSTSFNQDLSAWDVSSLYSARQMFTEATSFNSPTNWTTFGNVQDVYRMFQDTAYNQPLNNLNIASATNLELMFADSPFNQPLNSWNVSSITNISGMFYNNTSFNQPLDLWDVSNITDMGATFRNASSFNQPLNQWNTASLTNISRMFEKASAFNQQIGNFTIASITDMTNLFLDTNMSITNFNKTLQDWIQQATIPSGITITGVDYSAVGEPARDNFISTYSWTFSGGSLVDSSLFEYTLPTTDYNIDTSYAPYVNTNGSFTRTQRSTEVVVGSTDTIVYIDFIFDDTGASAVDGLYLYGATIPTANMTITDFGGIPLSRQGNQLKNYTGRFPTSNTNIPSLLSTTSGLGMFYGATNFNQKVSAWDTSTITDMSYMFYNASTFNRALNSWNLAGTSTTSNMFNGAIAFNQPLSLWSMSSITDLSHMFASTMAFNQDLSTWNLSAATTLAYMFADSEAFNSNTNWTTTTSVANMSHIFDGATTYNQLLTTLDTTAVTDMSYMFNDAVGFNKTVGALAIPVLNNAVNIFTGSSMSTTNYSKTLQSWVNQATVPTNVLNVGGVDYNSSGQVYITQLINTYGWTFATGSLIGSATFTYIIPTEDHNESYNPMSNDNGSFTLLTVSYETAGDLTTVLIDFIFDDSSTSASDGLYLYGANSSTDNMVILDFAGVPLSRRGRQFKQYLGEYPVSPTNIPTLLPNTSGREMFYESSGFNQDIGAWDTSTMTTMKYMFYNCTSFDQDIGNWNVGNVTDMSYMFRHASNFNQDLSAWNVSRVENMAFMFFRNYLFDSNISGWDVSSVTTMECMFYMAYSFNQNLGAWNISNITNMANMLDSTNLSETNFSDTLIGWEAGITPPNISLGAYDLTLNAAGVTAKNALIASPNNWLILIDILSPICFSGDCLVQTNSGLIRLDQVVAGKDTIRHIPIKCVTKTISRDKYLVKIKRFALKNGTPTRDVILSKNHKILHKGKLVKAYRLACIDGVSYIDNNMVPLYNILLDQKCKGFMHVNGIECETLCPSNGIVKLYRSLSSVVPEITDKDTRNEVTQKMIAHFNKEIEKTHYIYAPKDNKMLND